MFLKLSLSFFFANPPLVATPMSGAIGAGLGAAFLLFLAVASLPLIGFLLSLYMFIVERKPENNPSYKPVCNLSDRVSCTKAFRKSVWEAIWYFKRSAWHFILSRSRYFVFYRWETCICFTDSWRMRLAVFSIYSLFSYQSFLHYMLIDLYH